MALVNSLDARAYVNGRDISGDLNEISPDLSSDTRDVTTFGAPPYAAKVAATRQLATFQMRGFYSDDQLAGIDAIMAPLLGQTAQVLLWPAGPAAGMAGWGSMAALLTTWKVTSRVGEVVTVAAEWDAGAAGAAAAERIVSLADATPMVGLLAGAAPTASLPAVDLGAAWAGGGAAYFEVLQADSPSGLSGLKVEHSADNSTWATLATSTLVAAGFERVALAGPIQRYARVTYNLQNGKHLTLQVGLART